MHLKNTYTAYKASNLYIREKFILILFQINVQNIGNVPCDCAKMQTRIKNQFS